MPIGVVSCVVTVSVAVPLPPAARVMDLGDSETLGPLGEMLAERSMAPANPPLLANVIVDDPEPPGVICKAAGLDEMAKSGGTGCVTVMLWLVDAVAPAESRTVSWTMKDPAVV